MTESTMNLPPHFTGCASLAALGITLRKLDLLAPIRKLVQIPQKTVKDTPFEKLADAFISLLAGAAGLVEINSRLRSDRGLQQAFDASAAPNNRWSRKRSRPAPPKVSNRWSKR